MLLSNFNLEVMTAMINKLTNILGTLIKKAFKIQTSATNDKELYKQAQHIQYNQCTFYGADINNSQEEIKKKEKP